jgi:hypothetical protein
MTHHIDLSDYFCDRTTCPPVIGNVLVYRHMNHVTATYVRTLAPMLQNALTQALQARSRTQASLTYVPQQAIDQR